MVCDLYGECYKPQIQSKASIMMDDCDKRCLPSCKTELYLFEPEVFKTGHWSNAFSIIEKQVPTLVYIHIPEITLIQFICNLASLAGMWISFTMIGTLDKMKQAVFYFYEDHKLSKFSKKRPNLGNNFGVKSSHYQPIVSRRRNKQVKIPAR